MTPAGSRGIGMVEAWCRKASWSKCAFANPKDLPNTRQQWFTRCRNSAQQLSGVHTSTASFFKFLALPRETFLVEVRSIWECVLLRSGRTAYCIFPDISLQNPFAHARWEVLTHNNPNGGNHEIDRRSSLRPTALFECGSPLRPEHRAMCVFGCSGHRRPGGFLCGKVPR